MTKFAISAALILCALPVFAQETTSTSQPQPANITAKDPRAIADLLKDMGYRAELTKDKQGDPKINSAADGSKFGILFYGCTANIDCTSIQFYSGFDLEKGSTLKEMNDWNVSKRFAKAYLDEEDDPYLELDLSLDFGGISPDAFRDTVITWDSVISQFKGHIGW